MPKGYSVLDVGPYGIEDLPPKIPADTFPFWTSLFRFQPELPLNFIVTSRINMNGCMFLAVAVLM